MPTHPYLRKLREAADAVHPDPTVPQREAGNHRMGHVRVHGLDVTIEVAKGRLRKGVGADGKAWSREMKCHYGYVKGSTGADDEHVDVYCGPDPQSELAFVVNQVKRDKRFDETKVMLGFTNAAEAKRMYLAHVPDFCFGGMIPMTMAQFKKWVYSRAAAHKAKSASYPAEYKQAGSILWPVLHAGGLTADIAGLKALVGGERPQQPDAAATILADETHLDDLRGKKKKKPAQPQDVPAKIAAYYRDKYASPVHRPGRDNNDEEEEGDEEGQKRNSRSRLLRTAVPALGGGAAVAGGVATHAHTKDEKQPSQVVRFPTTGEYGSRFHVVRGRTDPHAPEFPQFEDTGHVYARAAGSRMPRFEGAARHTIEAGSPEDVLAGLRQKLKPDQQIGVLEISGHGSPHQMRIGNEDDKVGLNRDTAPAFAEGLKEHKFAPNSLTWLSSCDTGRCTPEEQWQHNLAKATGGEVTGAHAAILTDVPHMMSGDITTGPHRERWHHEHGRYGSNDEVPGVQRGVKEDTWRSWHADRGDESVEVQNPHPDAYPKNTTFATPGDELFDYMYRAGKPGAVAAALLAPALRNKQHARAVALAGTAAAAPQAISELGARSGEVVGNDALGVEQDAEATMAKALPHMAFMALPGLSYGAAKLLGRWKKSPEGV